MSEIYTIPIIKVAQKLLRKALIIENAAIFLLGFGDICFFYKKGIDSFYCESIHPIYTLKRPQIETRSAPGQPAAIPRAGPRFWLMMFRCRQTSSFFARLCSLLSAMKNQYRWVADFTAFRWLVSRYALTGRHLTWPF
jgi:hypothetical protein